MEFYGRIRLLRGEKSLIAIADFFDVSLDYLVGRSDVRERWQNMSKIIVGK